MRVYLGSDHAGFELKAAIISWLGQAGHEAVDCGPASYDPEDDYPVYVLRAAKETVGDPGSLGIVIGGSGNGEQIAANKVPGIRAALAWTAETARLARQHNDANVLSLGARMCGIEDGVAFAKLFIETPFSAESRHSRRLAMIADFEKTGELPVLFAGDCGRGYDRRRRRRRGIGGGGTGRLDWGIGAGGSAGLGGGACGWRVTAASRSATSARCSS